MASEGRVPSRDRCPVHYCGASLDEGQTDCGRHTLSGRSLSSTEGTSMSGDSQTERHKALTEAWQAVQREVVPLGGHSPWNDGFTTAVNKALNAILALRDKP